MTRTKTNLKPIDGFLLLDKPLGMSSNVALQKAKRSLSAEKAGHTGSLDPLATGMLPLCFGQAAKFSRFVLDEKKCYQATIQLGIQTATGDKEGEIIGQKPFTKPAQLDEVVKHFQGQIAQIPPMYSALKHQGRCLYELARKGQVIERAARTITIYELEFLSDDSPDTLTFKCVCSKGTYIRTLAEDIAVFLGTYGHLTALHRLWVHPFKYETMVRLEQIDERGQDAVIGLEHVLPQLLPKINLSEQESLYLSQGRIVNINKVKQDGQYCVFEGAFFRGIGELQGGSLRPMRMMEYAVV